MNHESHEDHRPGQHHHGMWQNLVWATGYNLVAIPLAAGALASADVCVHRRGGTERAAAPSSAVRRG